MKSTYKLLSIHLDRLPLPENQPELISESRLLPCSEIEDEYSLYDLLVSYRYLSGFKLLSLDPIRLMTIIKDKINDCNQLVVILDLDSFSIIVRRLYLKRILQSIYLIEKEHPDISVVLSGDLNRWGSLLSGFYAKAPLCNSKCVT